MATIQETIERLKKFPPDALLVYWTPDGHGLSMDPKRIVYGGGVARLELMGSHLPEKYFEQAEIIWEGDEPNAYWKADGIPDYPQNNTKI